MCGQQTIWYVDMTRVTWSGHMSFPKTKVIFSPVLPAGWRVSPLDFLTCIQLFWERLLEKMCRRQSRKVIWDMINTLFPMAVDVEPTFVAFHSHLRTCLWPLVPFFQISLENRADLNHPQYLLGLSRALFPTTFLETAVYDFLNQTMQTLTNSVTCVRSVWIDVSWVEDCWAFCIATHIILIPRIGCE